MAGHDAVTEPYNGVTVLRISPTLRGYRAGFCPEKSMPTPRMTMRKIKDVLRLKLQAQLSHEQIAAALRISKGAVTKYANLASAAGLDWLAVDSLSEAELERRLLAKPERRCHYVMPDYGRVHQQLQRKGMTLMLLWEEYQAEHAGEQTYRYTQFCKYYGQFARGLKRSMRQIHRAGEKLFIDYAGPTVALTDGGRAHVFVAALGASGYTFACATARQTMADWLDAIAQALALYGMKQSMSRKGNCFDNAAMESFFATLKAEYFYLSDFENVEQLSVGLKSYIDYYNRHRIKSKLGGMSPVEYRLQAARN